MDPLKMIPPFYVSPLFNVDGERQYIDHNGERSTTMTQYPDMESATAAGRASGLRRFAVGMIHHPAAPQPTQEQRPDTRTYYEKVRDLIEERLECGTSDAQGIIGAWELRKGGAATADVFMDIEENAGTDPVALADSIISPRPTT